MMLLETRRAVLRSVAQEINARYFSLCARLEEGRVTERSAAWIGAEFEEIESLMGYIRAESEATSREAVREAVEEVEAIWQEGAK